MSFLNKVFQCVFSRDLRVALSKKITALPNPNITRVETILQDYIGMCEGVKFHGQISQDLIAYLFFNRKKDGFFVDIGANDGVTYNNTFVFEQLGWKGICVEQPHPAVFKKLVANRKCDLRNVAVTSQAGKNCEGMSGHSEGEAA
jgi:hypothetical protein